MEPKKVIKCIVVCTNAEGSPDFFGCEIEVTEQDQTDGLHYELAKLQAEEYGYSGPMVVFDKNDGPSWLFEKIFKEKR